MKKRLFRKGLALKGLR